jgi:hypothetical protein
MVIYGVHRQDSSGYVGEIEVLTADRARAEDHARRASVGYLYGVVVVTHRELDQAGVYVVSVYKGDRKVTDHGAEGRWRKVRESPI